MAKELVRRKRIYVTECGSPSDLKRTKAEVYSRRGSIELSFVSMYTPHLRTWM